MLLDTSYQRWLQVRSAEVLSLVDSHVERSAASPAFRQRIKEIVAASRCARHPDRYQAPIHLPLLTYAGTAADDASALPIAAVTTLLWVGAELYDHLTDGDLPEQLRRYRDFELVMALASMSCVLPPAMIADLSLPADARTRMQRTLADGTLQMFAGQESDLSFTNTESVSPDLVAASVVAKNGAAQALFACLGAEMAGAGPEHADAYAAFGRSLGAVYQLQSDLSEMFYTSWCRDLAHGTRTLQIAICLEALSGEEREDFVELLDRARTERSAQVEVAGGVADELTEFELEMVAGGRGTETMYTAHARMQAASYVRPDVEEDPDDGDPCA